MTRSVPRTASAVELTGVELDKVSAGGSTFPTLPEVVSETPGLAPTILTILASGQKVREAFT